MTNRTPGASDTESKRVRVRVSVFSSFEEENEAEHRRLAAMSHEDRMREFAVLQARRWGVTWGRTAIAKRATWERVSW